LFAAVLFVHKGQRVHGELTLQAVTTIKEELAELEQGYITTTMVGVHTSSPNHNKLANNFQAIAWTEVSTSLKSQDPELAASGAGKPNEMFLSPGSKTGALSPQATIPDRVEVDIQTSPPSVEHQINSGTPQPVPHSSLIVLAPEQQKFRASACCALKHKYVTLASLCY
jgi:hypothetical protein